MTEVNGNEELAGVLWCQRTYKRRREVENITGAKEQITEVGRYEEIADITDGGVTD